MGITTTTAISEAIKECEDNVIETEREQMAILSAAQDLEDEIFWDRYYASELAFDLQPEEQLVRNWEFYT